jgi:hypothetical protein
MEGLRIRIQRDFPTAREGALQVAAITNQDQLM